MTIFRPSAQVVLWLRVDEGMDTAPLRRQLSEGDCADVPTGSVAPEATNTSVAIQLQNIVEAIKRVKDLPDSSFEGDNAVSRAEAISRLQSQYDEILNSLSASDRQPQPASFVGASPDSRFVRAGVLPASVSIDRNGFRTADTATVEIAWKDAPFDPRLARACAVEIVIGVVAAQDFAKGINAFAKDPQGQLLSVVQQNVGPNGALAPNSTRFVGWVDNWSLKHGSNGDTISMECRDLTACFLDTPLVGSINLNLPLDQGIAEFCRCFPTLRGIAVRFGDVNDADPGTPPIPSAAIPRQRRARRGKVARQARSGDQKMSVWDHITDVCVAAGFLPVIRDYELRICRARTLFTNQNPRPLGLVYGRNLSSLEFTRKLAGTKVPTIEVRSYDPSIARTRWARWPVGSGQPTAGIIGVSDPSNMPTRPNEVTPTGSNPDERIRTIVIKSMSDPVRLTAIAHDYYEQVGRQELEGSFETETVFSWDMDKDEEKSVADLLSLVAGDPVEIKIASQDQRQISQNPSTVAQLQALSRSARADYLRRLGWSSQVAEQFARLQDAPGFSTTFRTQSVQLSFDSESGLSLKADFINFVVVGRETEAETNSTALEAGNDRSASGATTDKNIANGVVPYSRRSIQERRNQLVSARVLGMLDGQEYELSLQELDEADRSISAQPDSPPPGPEDDV